MTDPTPDPSTDPTPDPRDADRAWAEALASHDEPERRVTLTTPPTPDPEREARKAWLEGIVADTQRPRTRMDLLTLPPRTTD